VDAAAAVDALEGSLRQLSSTGAAERLTFEQWAREFGAHGFGYVYPNTNSSLLEQLGWPSRMKLVEWRQRVDAAASVLCFVDGEETAIANAATLGDLLQQDLDRIPADVDGRAAAQDARLQAWLEVEQWQECLRRVSHIALRARARVREPVFDTGD
jgi:hypothetical protein